VQRRRPDVTDAQFGAMKEQVLEHFPDAMVEGYEVIAGALTLPDPDDRHVLAAAIVGKCQGLITANLKDFPAEVVGPFQLEVVHPDDFIVNIIDIDPTKALAACRNHRAAMTKSNPSPDDYLERFRIAGLVQAHARLNEQKDLI
jgi:hypothetical protein